MATSRLERIGTIYTRVSSLLEGKAWTSENVPLWYNIYKAFPPKLEPTYDRVVPSNEIKDIYYTEDIIRAKFQKEYNKFLRYNLMQSNSVSWTKKFIAVYNDIKKSGVADEDIYEKAIEQFKVQNPNFGELRGRSFSESSTDTHETGFKSKNLNVNISEMWKTN